MFALKSKGDARVCVSCAIFSRLPKKKKKRSFVFFVVFFSFFFFLSVPFFFQQDLVLFFSLFTIVLLVNNLIMSSHSWVQHSYKPGQLFRPDVNNSVLLLVDHQTGLNSLARDFESTEFKNAVLFLAEAAKEAQIPVIVTTSFETGPNGPAWPELVELFPVGTKGVTYIRRPGNINAWDDDAFTAAIKATGVKQLIIAGFRVFGISKFFFFSFFLFLKAL